jgi:pimeloyl-ACP methyl ester carboxylesterase
MDLVENLNMPGNYWLIDLPMNGTNDHFKNPSYDDYAQWGNLLVQVIEKFENPVLVGHSFGGYLPLFCPKLENTLKGLIILNSVPTLQSDIFAKVAHEHELLSLSEAQGNFIEKMNLKSLQDLYIQESFYFFAPKDRDDGINKIIKKMQFSIPAEHWWYTKGAQSYKKITWVPQKTPTLIIGGSNDYITPLSVFGSDHRFKRNNIEIQQIPGAGHFPWFEQPKLLNNILMQFTKNLQTDDRITAINTK